MIELNSVELGNPEGPPVVFIHGMMSSNLQWEPHLERLGEHLRMFLVELPGHGDSPAPDRAEAYGPSEVISSLDAIRSGAQLESWWIVGQSLGAAVAGRYVLANPDRSRGLAVTNSRAAFGKSRSTNLMIPETAEERRALRFHPVNAKRFPEDLKEKMMKAADKVPSHSIRHLIGHVAEWSCRDDLALLNLPVLVVNGRWEKAFQPFIPVAKERIQNLTLVELEGGHSVNVERPREFEDALLEFVQADG